MTGLALILEEDLEFSYIYMHVESVSVSFP